MSTKLILIRHGETDYSLEKRYCGFTDPKLNNNGMLQAEKLYPRLQKEKIDSIYSSNSMRALNFARIAFKDLDIENMPELKEMNFGIFEGLRHDDIMKSYHKIYTSWIDNPFSIAIPEGESLNDFKKRIEDVLKKIIFLSEDKKVAIVTHAGPIRIIIANILNSKDIWEVNPGLASISIVEFKNGKGKIQLFNDRSYLHE